MPEFPLLALYLVAASLLLGLGLAGLICRRNQIVMLLALAVMFQAPAVSLIAWSRFHNSWEGISFALVAWVIGLVECGLLGGLTFALWRAGGTVDATRWQQLREAGLPEFADAELLESILPAESASPNEPVGGN